MKLNCKSSRRKSFDKGFCRGKLLIFLLYVPILVNAQSEKNQSGHLNYLLAGDYRGLADYAGQQLVMDSLQPSMHYYKGYAHLQLMQYQKAWQHLAISFKLDSTNSVYGELLATCLYELEHFRDADTVISQALAAEPDRISLLLLKGRILQRLGQNRAAMDLYYQLAVRDSSNPWYPIQIGLLAQRVDSLAEAEMAYEWALQIDSTNTMLFARLGQVYLAQEQESLTDSIDQRIDLLSRGIARDSTNGLIYRFRGGLYLMQAFYRQAADDFASAIAQGDSTAFSFRHLGVALFHQSEYDLAQPVFAKTIELDPGDAQAWYYLGFCYKWHENLPKAIECLNKALELSYSPSVSDVYSGLGQMHSLQREFNQAKKNFERAYEMNENDPAPLAQLGILTEESGGDKRIALEYYQRYLSHKGKNDPNTANYVQSRVRVIKEGLFMQGTEK